MGYPNSEVESEFILALAEYLDPDRLTPLVNLAEAWCLMPGLPIPAQAFLLRIYGKTLPLAISFQQPSPDRKIQRVLLWESGTLTGEAEARAVASIFEQEGVSVERMVPQDMSNESFKEMYASDVWDIIWVAAHAEFDHYTPHRAAIAVAPNQWLELEEIAAISVPEAGGRRLLVLNVCDGAKTHVHGGPVNMGLAASVAGRNQAVISHLWPTHNISAASFGVLLAMHLSGGQKFFNSFEHVLAEVSSGTSNVRGILSKNVRCVVDLIERLESTTIELSHLIHAGSPVFYE